MDDNDSSPATNAIGMSYYCRNNGVATIVYLSVDEADYKVTGGNNDVIFFAFESGSKKIEDSDNEYYTRLFAKEQSYRSMMRILGY